MPKITFNDVRDELNARLTLSKESEKVYERLGAVAEKYPRKFTDGELEEIRDQYSRAARTYAYAHFMEQNLKKAESQEQKDLRSKFQDELLSARAAYNEALTHLGFSEKSRDSFINEIRDIVKDVKGNAESRAKEPTGQLVGM